MRAGFGQGRALFPLSPPPAAPSFHRSVSTLDPSPHHNNSRRSPESAPQALPRLASTR